MKYICRFLLVGIMMCMGGAHAQDKADDKAALIALWEKNIQTLPTTVLFKKTAIAGEYEFQTNLFPYKGRLKVLNIIISDTPAVSDIIEGSIINVQIAVTRQVFIETKLLDAPEKFFEDMYRSKVEFDKLLSLYYVQDKAQWLTRSALKDYASEAAAEALALVRKKHSTYEDFKKPFYIMDLAPFYVFVGIFVLCLTTGIKKRKQYWDFLRDSDIATRKSLENQEAMIALLKELSEKK